MECGTRDAITIIMMIIETILRTILKMF